MELIERPNMRAVHYLNSISYDKFRKDCIDDALKNEEKRPKETDIKTWYDLLKQFCKTNIKTKGVTKRIYAYSQTTPAGLGGRLFGSGSIQGIWNVYRGLLMRGIGTDIDMVNCHPILLRFICHKHNIKCSALEYYINHRDECLAEFSSRSVGKCAYLKATNDDKYTRNKSLPQSFKDYDKEMKTIQKQLVALPDYKYLQETIPEYKLTKNYNGSTINRILCYYENIVLQHCIHVLNGKGIELAILMFDGCMPYGNFYDSPDLLAEIETYVEEQMPNLNMKWGYKEHDETLQIPDEFDESSMVDEISPVSSDLDAAKKIFSLYPHWKYCHNVLYVFNDETGMWESELTSYRSVITRFEPHLRLPSEDGKKSKSYGSCLRLMDTVPQLIRTLCVDNNWLTRVRSSSLGKVLFTNGYYDFHKKEFYNSFDPNIVFMGRIHHAFEKFDEDDLTYMDSIIDRLFTQTLGQEVGDYLLLNIGMALSGDAIKMKRCLFGLGCSNAGKGVLTNAILKSFGDYAGSFNAESMAYRKTMNDEAQIMRAFMLLAFKRIIISNELKSTVELNGNMIKKIASGGDELVGRLHCGNETAFQTHFIPLILANDLPKIKPYDDAVDNRVRFISFEKTFVDNPTNVFELKADENIKYELETERFKKCFVGAVLRRYLKHTDDGYKEITPAEVIKAKQDWTPEDSNVMEAFKNEFEITGKDSDFVSSSRIEEWVNQKRLGISMKKFGMELTKYCVVNKLEGVVNKLKKIVGKPHRVWCGISERVEEPDSTGEEW